VLRGLGYRLLLAATIVATVALTAGAFVAVFDADSSDLGESVWWAFLRLTDPGYLGDDEGLARRTISTVVTVLGYLLFLGLLIAILTQWLNQLIEKLESGVTQVALSDHIIILGWSQRTPTIVRELLRTRERVERFLARHGARQLHIVVLADKVDAALVSELRERLGDLWNDRQILVRSGTPLRLDHLERVAFLKAAALILPGADHAEQNPEAVDAQTVKTLMSISQHASKTGDLPPMAVAEVYDARKAAVGRKAYLGDSEILAADEIISRLIVQSVRQHGLCAVYAELLTLDAGNALYVRRLDDWAGAKLADLHSAFPRAILLGCVRSFDASFTLDSSPETVLEGQDLLLFIARSFDDCAPQESLRASSALEVTAAPRPVAERRRLLILGWSRKVPALLKEFARYGPDAFEIDIVSATPLEQRQELLEMHSFTAPSDSLRQIKSSYNAPDLLERLQPQRYDNILLLASERLTGEEQADANTIFVYLMLCGILPKEGPTPQLFVELLDEENLFLIERKRADVLVSPTVVSYLLSQVALRRELAAVFSELSRPWGPQIVLQPASDFLATTGPVRFEDLERAADRCGEIALGFQLAQGGLALNPDRDADWVLEPGDQVVLLTLHAEPGKEQSVDRSSTLTGS
jgi:hypothetical protein